MNKYDSQRMEGVLASNGMRQVEEAENADVIILNTCSVREKAENKVFSMIGRLSSLKNGNTKPLIGLGGCMATFWKENIFQRAPALDFAFGPDALERLPCIINERIATGKKQLDIGFGKKPAWDGPESFVRPSTVTAWVGIMKGCDNHCSYCVVPGTRGSEVSRSADSILSEVEELAKKGFKEVTLIGQNVNSYDWQSAGGRISFPSLLKKVDKVTGIERIRFMSSHPKDLTDELIETISGSKKICSSIHLPVQSGSDRILKMMNRKYSSAEYLEKVGRLKSAIEGITISTDLMVGFPSETEDDFKQTLELMEKVRFDALYLFIYSKRGGTPAEKYDGHLSRGIAQERFEIAYSLHKRLILEKNAKFVGRTVEVLCEGQYNGSPGSGDDSFGVNGQFGRSDGNHDVAFVADRDMTGRFVQVEIADSSAFKLRGIASNERVLDE